MERHSWRSSWATSMCSRIGCAVSGYLIAALKVAVPFEINLTPEVVKQLQAENGANPVQTYRTVSDLSYAGDEGGIVCHIVPPDEQQALFISLTHVRMPRSMPLARAVADYQKHRVKKLKKQGGT